MVYKHSKWKMDGGRWSYSIKYDPPEWWGHATDIFNVTVSVNEGTAAERLGVIHTNYPIRYLTPDAAHELARALDMAAKIAVGEARPAGEGA